MSHIITSVGDLKKIYGERSPRADKKVLSRLDKHCRTFIANCPFLTMATNSPKSGTDCSPKGDAPGFVKVLSDTQLAIPDRPGNNRIDSLLNLIENPQVGLLFLIPGVKETLRINGEVQISVEPELLQELSVDGKEPRCAFVVTVQEAYIHCAKSIMRSEIWNPEKQIDRKSLPSMGKILADHIAEGLDADAYDASMEERYRKSLY
ncbi:pyridoxamine 5'-phosphate oxidase family protein [Kiloniella majae]|uniref:pyridoxamine 5'-phosphate oxidase family protein n=1 Tax=Kiloniella majae TaxID=1938558 RepID=UPI000A277DDC|nr:pyridoxamine 5'-phosphate oxidase family protein [Kiloniella majae]